MQYLLILEISASKSPKCCGRFFFSKSLITTHHKRLKRVALVRLALQEAAAVCSRVFLVLLLPQLRPAALWFSALKIYCK